MYFRILALIAFLVGAGFQSAKSQLILDQPPIGEIRTMAEWEEIQAIVVSWTSYKPLLAEIIKYAQEECKVIVHIPTNSTATSVTNELLNNYDVIVGSNVIFRRQPFNSIWIRDYAANSVYMNDVDSLFLVDWKYNRPTRPSDDTLPRSYARLLNLNLVQNTVEPNRVVHTGGNFMSDGFGTGFSSNLVLEENPTKSEAQIDAIMQNFMGISRYIKMETLPYDGIHHIDMHMKLFDEETLLMTQYPTGIADGPQIEANLLYVLDNYNSVFGTPYKVVRVPSPADSLGDFPDDNGDYLTYSNSVFVNKTVLLTSYREQYDTTALRIYKENLPGYRIQLLDCNDIIGASGAIHCITHSVGVNDPMLISHQALNDTYDTANAYAVKGMVKHRSGIQQAQLFYRTDSTASFTSMPMTLSTDSANLWEAAIPAQSAGTHVEYYIQGFAQNGKTQVRPITAPTGFWSFDVLDSTDIITQTKAIEQLFEITLFPNPSNGITCIPIKSLGVLSLSLDVFDINGRLVTNIFNGTTIAGENRFYINTENWKAGIYIVKARTSKGSAMQKLVVYK
jgi:agmatine/peptidylarginine deiminase